VPDGKFARWYVSGSLVVIVAIVATRATLFPTLPSLLLTFFCHACACAVTLADLGGSRRGFRLVGMDCEMVETENDKHALCRVTVVELGPATEGEYPAAIHVLVDMLVMPSGVFLRARTSLHVCKRCVLHVSCGARVRLQVFSTQLQPHHLALIQHGHMIPGHMRGHIISSALNQPC